MAGRDSILKAIRQNKPRESYRADYSLPVGNTDNAAKRYRASLEKNGGTLFNAGSNAAAQEILDSTFPDAVNVVSLVDGIRGSRTVKAGDDPHGLEDIDVAVVRGLVGVAENAAIWLGEKEIVKRALPFIAQHLVIVLDASDIVPTMHEAYAKINVRDSSYGVFVAGPSKTADIEQSLVIGAHGPRSLVVVLMY